MKRVWLLLGLACLSAEVLAVDSPLGFRKLNFGMTLEEAKAAEAVKDCEKLNSNRVRCSFALSSYSSLETVGSVFFENNVLTDFALSVVRGSQQLFKDEFRRRLGYAANCSPYVSQDEGIVAVEQAKGHYIDATCHKGGYVALIEDEAGNLMMVGHAYRDFSDDQTSVQ